MVDNESIAEDFRINFWSIAMKNTQSTSDSAFLSFVIKFKNIHHLDVIFLVHELRECLPG